MSFSGEVLSLLDAQAKIREKLEERLLGTENLLKAIVSVLTSYEPALEERDGISEELNAARSELEKSLAPLDRLKDVFEQIEGGLATALSNCTGRVDALKQRWSDERGEIEEAAKEAVERAEESGREVAECSDDWGKTARQCVEETRDEFKQRLGTVVDDINEAALSTELAWADACSKAREAAQRVLAGELPEGFGEGTRRLDEQFRSLRETGLNELGKLCNAVDDVVGKVEVVTDLAEQAKPVLQLAEALA